MDKYIKEFTENYLNKIEMGYKLPPEIKLEEFWKKITEFRKQKRELVPLKNQADENFWYFLTHIIQKRLHEIDSYGRDTFYNLVKSDIKNELIKESLIEEAFYSSVIEGAFSTLKKAKELVEKKESPKDKSEQMVLNNFYAMRFIVENMNKNLSSELILELHKIVTDKTLDDPSHTGRYRNDAVYITDSQGRIVYAPPPADKVQKLIDDLIEWINEKEDKHFIHPVIKSAILHFYFVYVHPFFDGNGRTARALFYFYLIKNQYDFFKYFSISSIISKSRASYYKSIKDVEDCDSDITYFLSYMSNAILEAIKEITLRISEHYQKEFLLEKINDKKIILNRRQERFINKFLLWKGKVVNIEKYKNIYNIVYQTARSDLLDLADKNILIKEKKGKVFIFRLNSNF